MKTVEDAVEVDITT